MSVYFLFIYRFESTVYPIASFAFSHPMLDDEDFGKNAIDRKPVLS